MGSVEIVVRVTPRAHADELVCRREDILVARVRAPALENRANAAVCRLVAKRLGIRASSVTVVRGVHAREKRLRIDGVTDEQVARALA